MVTSLKEKLQTLGLQVKGSEEKLLEWLGQIVDTGSLELAYHLSATAAVDPMSQHSVDLTLGFSQC